MPVLLGPCWWMLRLARCPMTRQGRVRRITVLLVGPAAMLCGSMFLRHYLPRAGPSRSGSPSRGAFLPAPRGYAWNVHPRTLILALHVGCPYCDESMEFYKELEVLEQDQRTSAHLVLLC